MTKGICPFAAQLPIPAGSNDPAITPRIGILHVADSEGFSLFNFFKRNQHNGSGVESHFYIRYDGTIEQYRNIYREADANYKANRFAVSIETEGKASGAWTDEQIFSIKMLMRWLSSEGIPLQVAPTWDGAGWGYHIMFGTPGPWTKYRKSCPGPTRISQFNTFLVPWLMGINNSVPTPDIPKPNTSKVTLRKGDINARVTTLQIGLNRVFPAYSKLKVDGIFGNATDWVVKEFQRRTGLMVDGIVGPITARELAKYGITF